jgi:hypothetical protein
LTSDTKAGGSAGFFVGVGRRGEFVTEPNDIQFLDYFHQRRVAGDEAAPAEGSRRSPGPIGRVFRWMTRPI